MDRRRVRVPPTNRLGGPASPTVSRRTKSSFAGRLPPLPASTKKAAGILVGPGHSEGYRCSPYMFYRGETLTYDDPSQPPVGKAMKPPRSPSEDSVAPQSAEEGESGAGADAGDEGRVQSPIPNVSPPLLLPTANLAALEEYDDEFTGGAVLATVKELKKRRERVMKRRFNDVLRRPCPVNLAHIHARLAAEVRNDDGIAPTIRREHLLFLMKDTYAVENDAVLDFLCRELDRQNSGEVPFSRLMELLDQYVAGEFRVQTARACFRVFDVDERLTLTLFRMKKLRASKPKNRYGTSGASMMMIKTVLDLWLHDPGQTTTLTFDTFLQHWDSSEHVISGFLEEILRFILATEYRYPREAMLNGVDPPTLLACHNGLVPGYDRSLISAIPG